MNTTRNMCLGFLLTASAAALAAPSVDPASVTISQDPGTRLVTVNYRLSGEAAIVTADFQTNTAENATGEWVSIGAENVCDLAGAVNCIVTDLDKDSSFVWNPVKSWPNHVLNAGNIRAVVKAWSLQQPPDYMAIDLTIDGLAGLSFYPAAESVPGGITSRLYKTEQLLMRRIPASNVKWRMGSPANEPGKSKGDKDGVLEIPHQVVLTEDYYLAVYPTTQLQYKRIMKTSTISNQASGGSVTPSEDPDVTPIVRVGFETLRGAGANYDWPTKTAVDGASVVGTMRSRWPISAEFDLPTESQWEYACRAGVGTGLNSGSELAGDGTGTGVDWGLSAIGWYAYNSGNVQHPVGKCQPNAWKLYDMEGNVNEYCRDWYGTNVYSTATVYIDPKGPEAGMPTPKDARSIRVTRGGYYNDYPYNCRCASRSGFFPNSTGASNVGFRMSCRAIFALPAE